MRRPKSFCLKRFQAPHRTFFPVRAGKLAASHTHRRTLLSSMGIQLGRLHRMSEDTYRRWDVLIKVVALVGSALAIWAYFDKKEAEFRMPFWDVQLKLYFEATEITSKVASLPDGEDRDKATRRFWELYYGPLRVVEDSDNVSHAMEVFGTCLREKCSQTKLQNHALDLADACAKSIAETWSQNFNEYKSQVKRKNGAAGKGEK